MAVQLARIRHVVPRLPLLVAPSTAADDHERWRDHPPKRRVSSASTLPSAG
ncbi:hypothetical protein [Streptomyces cyslabdanicus]|uniref:hypothetical protein n=1 Tax=Streptomyces cyslabdanicus TaxID=1470456 RepID=UPI004043C470